MENEMEAGIIYGISGTRVSENWRSRPVSGGFTKVIYEYLGVCRNIHDLGLSGYHWEVYERKWELSNRVGYTGSILKESPVS